MFKIIIHAFQFIILMFKIIINAFQMDIIHLFQQDVICILMKYDSNVYDHNSCFKWISIAF